MAPHIGRIAFHLGFLVLVLALFCLPFLEVGSAEFVVDLIAIAMASMFLGLVVWSVRREVKRSTLKGKGDADVPGCRGEASQEGQGCAGGKKGDTNSKD
jgi:membrane protein implicated in regulation of membrane protease activity